LTALLDQVKADFNTADYYQGAYWSTRPSTSCAPRRSGNRRPATPCRP